jgi:hypothetical protein
MIDIYIKKLTGELLVIQYDKEWSAERLHDSVYDILPIDEKPFHNEKWKIMLFLRGEWIIANEKPVNIEEGEMLDLFIESGKYKIDFCIKDYRGGLWDITFKISGSLNIDFSFNLEKKTGFWYFDNEVEIDDDYYHVRNFAIDHVDAHDFINTFDLPLCVREFAYSQYFFYYSEILPLNTPRPFSYYSNYNSKDARKMLKIEN